MYVKMIFKVMKIELIPYSCMGPLKWLLHLVKALIQTIYSVEQFK